MFYYENIKPENDHNIKEQPKIPYMQVKQLNKSWEKIPLPHYIIGCRHGCYPLLEYPSDMSHTPALESPLLPLDLEGEKTKKKRKELAETRSDFLILSFHTCLQQNS